MHAHVRIHVSMFYMHIPRELQAVVFLKSTTKSKHIEPIEQGAWVPRHVHVCMYACMHVCT